MILSCQINAFLNFAFPSFDCTNGQGQAVDRKKKPTKYSIILQVLCCIFQA